MAPDRLDTLGTGMRWSPGVDEVPAVREQRGEQMTTLMDEQESCFQLLSTEMKILVARRVAVH